MSNIKVTQTNIKELVVIEPKVFEDQRGFFMESYNLREFIEIGIPQKFVQDNHSKSKKGVLRGLHFQTKHPQAKLIRVIKGEIFDVAVDLRSQSDTFGKWYGIYLSSQNKKQLYVPEGFAHGFITLCDDTEIQYKCTDYYYPEYDSGIIWNDIDLAIDWPLHLVEEITLSQKDKGLQTLKQYIENEGRDNK